MFDNYHVELIKKLPIGYLEYQIIYDENGDIFDYKCIEYNRAFQEIIGMKQFSIEVGEECEIIQDIKKYLDNECLGEKEFEYYFIKLKKRLKIKVFSIKKDHIVAFITDVSKEFDLLEKIDKISNKLDNSINDYQTLLNSIPSGVCLIDNECKIRSWNIRAEEITGYLSNEVIGKKCNDIGFGECEKCSLLKIDPSNVKSKCEGIIIKNDEGNILNISKNVETFNNNECSNLRGIVCFNDITEQKSIENKFYKLFDNNPSLMAITRLSDNKYVEVNKAFLSKLGYKKEEVIGKTAVQLNLFFENDRRNEILKKLEEKSIINDVEFSIKGKAGNTLIGIFSGEIIKDQNEKLLLSVMTDITELKQTELELQKERFRLESIIKGTNIGTWEWNVQTGETIFNERWANIIGYTLEELYPISIDTWMKYAHPEDLKISGTLLEKHFNKEIDYYEFESRMKHKDGHWVWVWDRGCVSIWGDDGKPLIMTGTHQDITKQKNSEFEIKLSEEKFRNIYIDSPDAYLIMELEQGVIVDCNKATEAMLKGTKEEIIGLTPSRLSPEFQPDGAPSMILAEERIKEAFTKGKVNFDWVHKKIDGTEFWVNVSVSAIDYIDRKVLLVAWRDIDEKRMLEQKVKLNEIKLQKIYDVLDIGLSITDEIGNIIDCNKAFEKIFGVSREMYLEGIYLQSKWSIFKEDGTIMPIEELAYVKALSSKKPVYNSIMKVSRDDNKHIWINISAIPIGLPGYGVVTTYVDITKSKDFEWEQIRLKNEAEVANRAKSMFLANMSHEIRTPLNGILGFLELLQLSNISLEQKDYINEAKSASKILLNLINDILDFSKIESGKLNLEYITFNIRVLVDETISMFVPKASEKGIDLYGVVNENVPDELIGDPTRLRQILNNLLSNALKFTNKGVISVNVELKEEFDDAVVIEFEVKDTGIGINKDSIGCLFKSFTQADGSTTRKYGGTGLGLSISKELVLMMGGAISVESELGKGTTFTFSVQMKIEKSTNDVVYKEFKGVNIMVVDEDIDNRNLMVSYLKEFKMNVIEVYNAGNAINLIISNSHSQNRINVALIDDKLSEMNYIEFAKVVKSIPSANNIKLLLVTSKKKYESALENGYLSCIEKPINRKDFVSVIVNALSDNSGINSSIPEEIQGENNLSIESKDTSKISILVVEDNYINCKVIDGMMKKRGMTCDVVYNGKAAIEAYSKKEYDIILMDCQMPIMDGYESTIKIREVEGDSKHAIIIAMTANAMKEDEQRCIDVGMDYYISKPIDFSSMFELINEIVKKQQVIYRELC